MPVKTELTFDQIIDTMKENGFVVKDPEELPNGQGHKISAESGEIICLYKTKSITFGGTGNIQKLQDLILDDKVVERSKFKKNVFVVYGHDRTSKQELEGMLMRWGLNPIVLDRITSESNTLIEQLEKYIDRERVDYAIILVTPDDEGHPKGIVNEKKYRPRQNVILELGMVLGKLKRKNIAIIVKRIDGFEYPSDINGVLYIPFGEKLEEDVRVKLAQEMNAQGFKIDLGNL